MAEGTINLGDYELTDDANGDLVIKDPQGNTVQKWDDTNNVWDFNQQELDNLGQATIGPISDAVTSINWDRPDVLKSDTTVQVPQDESTIQDAARQIPRRMFGVYTIAIDETAGDFAEHVVIPPVYPATLRSASSAGNAQVRLERQGTSGKWETSSLVAVAPRGLKGVQIENGSFNATNTWDDDNWAVAVLGGGGSLGISGCDIVADLGTTTPQSVAYQAQGASAALNIEGTHNLGTDNVEIGIRTKSGGSAFVDPAATINGSVEDHGYEAFSGIIEHQNVVISSTNEMVVAPDTNAVIGQNLSLYDDQNNTQFAVLDIDDGDVITLYDRAATERVELVTGGQTAIRTGDGFTQMRVTNSEIQVEKRVDYRNSSTFDDTADSMTANPETDTESGYFEVKINGTIKQVPFYDP